MTIPLYLADILEHKKREVEGLYKNYGLDFYIQKHPIQHFPSLSFKQFLSQDGLRLIAEIKKASPSKGIIRPDFDPVHLGLFFQANGASALSVLTEKDFFMGSSQFIPALKSRVEIPVLRKDFLFDPIQIHEAKYLGADAILLIKAILSVEQCAQLMQLAASLNLDVLMEVHTQEELEEVLGLGVDIVGINNRNLNTFEVDIHCADRLLDIIRAKAPDTVVVAESGYQTIEELIHLDYKGFDAVLIGEGLAKDPQLLTFFKD